MPKIKKFRYLAIKLSLPNRGVVIISRDKIPKKASPVSWVLCQERNHEDNNKAVRLRRRARHVYPGRQIHDASSDVCGVGKESQDADYAMQDARLHTSRRSSRRAQRHGAVGDYMRLWPFVSREYYEEMRDLLKKEIEDLKREKERLH